MAPIAYVTALLAALAPLVASVPTPDSVSDADLAPRWSDISFSGNGCPQGHEPTLASENGDTRLDSPLTFTFDGKFRASTSPDKNRMANCQAHISTRGSGWQIALSDIWVDGRGKLASKASLDYYTTVFFSADAAKTQTLDGTITNSKDSSTSMPLDVHSSAGSSGLWSACATDGHIVNVNFRIVLPDQGSSNFEVNSEKLAFKWRRC